MSDGQRDLEKLGRSTVDGLIELVDALLAAEQADDLRVLDEAQEAIQNDALSVQVRGDWHSPGAEAEDVEYNILLGWGGPAMRLVGELNEHGQPETATVETQDWGTPWTDFLGTTDEEDEKLLRYASCFYFGE